MELSHIEQQVVPEWIVDTEDKKPDSIFLSYIVPPTSKKLTGHIGLGLCVRPSMHPSVRASGRSRTVHARVLKFYIWIRHVKIFDTRFFFLSELSPFLELCPFKKTKKKKNKKTNKKKKTKKKKKKNNNNGI